MTQQQHAATGAKLLDEMLPHWQHRINLGKLTMEFKYKCILGQCYGDYNAGLAALELDEDTAISCGFTQPADASSVSDWCDLEEAWREEIIKRRGR